MGFKKAFNIRIRRTKWIGRFFKKTQYRAYKTSFIKAVRKILVWEK